jgi:putative oxidoreductase
VLFVVFGWGKLTNYSGTVGYMTQLDLPMPSVTALDGVTGRRQPSWECGRPSE